MHDKPLTLMAVHAHPDDEIFGTGGVLTRYHIEGIRTVLVCSTLGEEGEIHDPDLDPDEARPRLGAIRRKELRRSCAILGIDDLLFLGYRDSGMVGTPANQRPDNFHNADREEATGRLVRIIREVQPQVVITYDERGGYGHPDHIAAHHTTLAAVAAAGDSARYPEQRLAPWQTQKLYFSAFPRSFIEKARQAMREQGMPDPFEGEEFDPSEYTVPDEVITTVVDVTSHALRKREAFRAHRTQISDDDFFLRMPDDMFIEGMGREHFIRTHSLVAVPTPETDLFAGLR